MSDVHSPKNMKNLCFLAQKISAGYVLLIMDSYAIWHIRPIHRLLLKEYELWT